MCWCSCIFCGLQKLSSFLFDMHETEIVICMCAIFNSQLQEGKISWLEGVVYKSYYNMWSCFYWYLISMLIFGCNGSKSFLLLTCIFPMTKNCCHLCCNCITLLCTFICQITLVTNNMPFLYTLHYNIIYSHYQIRWSWPCQILASSLSQHTWVRDTILGSGISTTIVIEHIINIVKLAKRR